MKNVVVIVGLLLAGYSGFSQDTPDTLEPKFENWQRDTAILSKFTDSLLSTYNQQDLKKGKRVMSPAYYDAFFSRWLAYVNFAKDGYPDGNSALVAPNSAMTRARVTLAHKGGDLVYNAGTEVNFSNNIGNVISKSDVTSSTTFFASASKLPELSRKIYFNPSRAKQNDLDKIVMLKSFMAATQKKYESDYTADLTKYRLILDSIEFLDSIKMAGGTAIVPPRMMVDYYASMQKVRTYGLNEDSSYYSGGFDKQKMKSVTDSLTQVFDSLEFANDAVQNFQFAWFSGSFAYTRNDYSVYNGNAAFNKRVGDVYFDSVAFNGSFNFLFERTQKYQQFADNERFLDKAWLRSVFLTVNYNLSRDINYAHLSQVTLVTSQNATNPANMGPVDTVYQLQSQSKAVNITNKPEIDSWVHTFSAKLVTVLSSSSFMGLDLSFSASYGSLIEPIYSTQIGTMFRLTDSQSAKTKVNFELFLQLNDFGDSQHSGLSTWQRKVVGINASIPFSKLFF